MGKLSTRERVIFGGAVVSFIAAFLPWAAYDLMGTTLDVDGWSTGYAAIIGTLLLAAAGIYLLLRRDGYGIWAPSFGDTPLIAALAAAGLALVIISWATAPSTYHGVSGSGVGARYGLWLALAGGITETVAAIAEARPRLGF